MSQTPTLDKFFKKLLNEKFVYVISVLSPIIVIFVYPYIVSPQSGHESYGSDMASGLTILAYNLFLAPILISLFIVIFTKFFARTPKAKIITMLIIALLVNTGLYLLHIY